VCLAVIFSASALSSARADEYRYPRVYSPTGRPYGPSVAEYQYQRQYGQPWHGQGGLVSSVGPRGFNITVYPSYPRYGWYGNYGYGCVDSGYGYMPGYGYGYVPRWYVGNYYTPPVYADPSDDWSPNSFSRSTRSAPRWGESPPAAPPYKPQISSAELQESSARRLNHGDLWFRQLDYENAHKSYVAAVQMTPDVAKPHFRLGLVLTALGRYPDAIAEFKAGLAIDASWPATGEPLDELFGMHNLAEKSMIENRVADFLRRDMRNPDRLFLMGVLLHFDRNEQAGIFFETAHQFAGGGQHLEVFLRPTQPEDDASPVPDSILARPGTVPALIAASGPRPVKMLHRLCLRPGNVGPVPSVPESQSPW
jgi:hypothetical protein